MLPPPTTIATCTPRSCTRFTVRAMPWMRSASTPYSRGPMRASPESFRRILLKAGLPSPSTWDTANQNPNRPSLADLEAREPANHDVLARLCGDLRTQLLDRAPLVLVRVDVFLLQQHDPLEPLPE